MAIVASLDIVLRAVTGQADSKLTKTASVLGTLKNRLMAAAAAYLSFAGAARALDATLSGLARLDDLAESADKLSMSANSLRAMGNAAELSGGSMETVTKSLSIMQRQIGAASLTGGETVFNRLGLSLQALKAMAPEQQFIAISEAIMRLPDATARAKAANDVFGRGYSDLIPLMRDASQSIDEAREFIGRFGGELSEWDLSNIGKTQDAVDRLGQAVKLAWENFANKAGPGLERLIDRLLDVMEKLVALSNEFTDGPFWSWLTGTPSTFGAVPETVPLGQEIVNGKIVNSGAAVAGKDIAILDELDDRINRIADLDPFGFKKLDRLETKTVTIKANVEGSERGSPEELAKRFAVEFKVQQQIQVQQLRAQDEGNGILREMLDEIKKQTDELTEDANL